MLNIGYNVSLDVRDKRMPIYFENKNECVHCGGVGTLIFVDKFGRESNKDINPFDHIKCRKCGTIYSIRWSKDSNGDMKPSAVGLNAKRAFKNFVTANDIKKHGKKEFD